MHLHWRWGEAALVGASPRANFLGWGNGRFDQGAHTSAATPLVPPNQHLEVELDKKEGSVGVRYEVKALLPDFDAYQVMLEQGIGMAFNYNGLQTHLLVLLGKALHEIGATNTSKVQELDALRQSDPMAFDMELRHLYHKFYEHIRWYDEERSVKYDVQQIPGVNGPSSDLEKM